MVVSLTGAAGRFGQAASKSVELAFSELNKAAGAGGIAGCQLAFDLRDAQSQGTVAVDQARQLVDLKKVPAIIGGIICSVSIPIVTSVTAPAGVVQISPASTSPTLTKLGNRRPDQRLVLPHHHLRRAAGHRRGEVRDRPGHEDARRSSTSTTTSASTCWPSSAAPTRRWAAR